MIEAFIVGRLDLVIGNILLAAVCVMRSAFLDSVGTISITVSIRNLQSLY